MQINADSRPKTNRKWCGCGGTEPIGFNQVRYAATSTISMALFRSNAILSDPT